MIAQRDMFITGAVVSANFPLDAAIQLSLGSDTILLAWVNIPNGDPAGVIVYQPFDLQYLAVARPGDYVGLSLTFPKGATIPDHGRLTCELTEHSESQHARADRNAITNESEREK